MSSDSINNYMDITPFLKWPGGKRWFINNYADRFPKKFNTYFEPFLGSGAVYFHLKPSKTVFTDLNPDVIGLYSAIKSDFKYIVRSLQYHLIKHSEGYYHCMRKKEASKGTRFSHIRMVYGKRVVCIRQTAV
ncbi:MAG: hypothetical protein EOO07_29410 [Chitinophagaceae bacterium]|nr:MAG: hypothetical protein EOO07_29410 [Chitinophagaceae bacterium]